jgi:hypothetical protein
MSETRTRADEIVMQCFFGRDRAKYEWAQQNDDEGSWGKNDGWNGL